VCGSRQKGSKKKEKPWGGLRKNERKRIKGSNRKRGRFHPAEKKHIGGGKISS